MDASSRTTEIVPVVRGPATSPSRRGFYQAGGLERSVKYGRLPLGKMMKMMKNDEKWQRCWQIIESFSLGLSEKYGGNFQQRHGEKTGRSSGKWAISQWMMISLVIKHGNGQRIPH